jgi:hypothetical protein
MADELHAPLINALSRCDYGKIDSWWMECSTEMTMLYNWRFDAVISTCSIPEHEITKMDTGVHECLKRQRILARKLLIDALQLSTQDTLQSLTMPPATPLASGQPVPNLPSDSKAAAALSPTTSDKPMSNPVR